MSEEPEIAPEAAPAVEAGEPVLVALDFTADGLRVLLTTVDGQPLEREHWPLPPLEDEEAWAWEVGGRIASCFAREGQRRSALAVAVAAPGTVDPVAGRLLRSTGQASWDGLSVVEALRRHVDTPIAAENRTIAALLGEAWQGAAGGLNDVLYVSLRGIPQAAALAGGRPLRGAHFEAGALPALPELAPGSSLGGEDLEQIAGLLADATALLDPQLVILEGEEAHVDPLSPLLQQVLDRVAPGPHVAAGELGESAAVVGAVRIATTLAYEGQRKP